MPDDNPLLSLRAASQRLPNHPSIRSLWRWTTVGVRGTRLKTTLIGGRRYTTPADLARFLEKINADACRT